MKQGTTTYTAPRIFRGLLAAGVILLLTAGCGGGSLVPGAPRAAGPADGNGLVARQAADQDYDGVSDQLEELLGTDPLDIDTDHDGLTDQYELWGWRGVPIGAEGSMQDLADPNGNGQLAALDPSEAANEIRSKEATAAIDLTRVRVSAPGDPPILNDLDGDYIPTDFELQGFYYEIDPNTGEDWFVKWDGDYTRNYYKTDPTKWSTDGDPWSDWEEATKRNMDQRVKHPGDHPCIPAYPEIQAVLTGYSIEEAKDITTTTGKKTESSWSNSVSSTDTTESNWAVDASAKLSVTVGSESGVKAEVKAGFTFGGSNTYESTVSNDESGLSAEEWSQVTAGDTIETAKLILNLKLLNIGTMPSSETKALFNLKLGDFLIDSFKINLTSDQGYGELKAHAQEPLDIVVTNNGRLTGSFPGKDLYLSLVQLQSLQMGAPLTIEPVGFEADTLVSEWDQDTGRRVNLNVGPWSPYKSAIETVSARVVLDLGEDPEGGTTLINGLPPRRTEEIRVFAYDNTSNYVGSPPVITLRDAFVWGFGAQDTSFGPTVTIKDPISGQDVPAYLDNYVFGFDQETYEYVVNNFDSLDNILDLPLLPSNPVERVYIAKAPPLVDPGEGIDQSKPRVYWAQLMPYRQERIPEYKSLKVSVDPPTFYDPPILVFSHYRYNPVFDPVVRAYVDDVFNVSEVRFKPHSGAIGEQMLISDNPDDPLSGMAYEYRLPDHYTWTGFETVIAINGDGVESDPLPVFVADSTHYDEFGNVLPGLAEPAITGIHTGLDSTSILEDNTADFLRDGLRVDDLVINRTRNTQTTIVSVLAGGTRLTLDPGGWEAVPGVNPANVQEEEFQTGDAYSIQRALQQFGELGYFTGWQGDGLIEGYEYDDNTGSYGFSFNEEGAERNPPFDFVVNENWQSGSESKSILVDSAIGVGELGQIGWGAVEYSNLRKADFSQSSLTYYSGSGDTYGDNYKYVAKLTDGSYVVFGLGYTPHSGNPGQDRVTSFEFEVYRGI
jgi:hypothetical protein